MATWARGIDFKNTNNTKRIGGVGVYGTDTNAEKLYIGMGTEPWNNAGLQLTNSAINFKGNKIYHAGDKPTASEIGAAASNHNHNGIYVNDKASVSGNMNNAAGYRNALGMINLSGTDATINPNGQTGWHHFINMSYSESSGSNMWQTQIANKAGTTDLWVRSRAGSAITDGTAWAAPWTRILTGSNYKSIVTPANIGAAASNHTHNYLPLSGGTITGETVFNNYLSLNAWSGYGTGKAQIWYNGNNKQLIVQPNAVTDIIVNNNKVYHAGNKPTASEIGAAASSHTHNYAGSSSAGGAANLVYLPRVGGSSVSANYQPGGNRFELKEFANDCANMPSAHWYHILTGQGSDANYNTQLALGMTNNAVYFRNRTSGAWGNWKQLAFTDSSITGNSATATKLKTARTINGTNFDGSGNITTANWGTARTLTIGNTGKSVNGSGNVTWSLSEIGAAASSHTHSSLKSTDPVRPTSANIGVVADRSLSMMLSTSSMTTGKPLSDGYILNFNWDNNGGWASQLYVQNSSSPKVQVRGMNAGTWGEWNTLYGTNNKPTASDIGALTQSTADGRYVGLINNNGFYGLSANGDASNWIRTTVNGIIPFQSGTGTSNLGTSSWRFKEAHIATIYEGGTALSSKYAAASHSHSYLPLSGGTMTGAVTSSVSTGTHIAGNKGTAIINSTAAGNGYNMLAKMNSTNGIWTMGSWGTNYCLFYTAKSVVDAGTNSFTKQAILLNEAGNTTFPGTVTASSFNGNATSATKLQTARAIKIGNTSKNFDGSANVTWTLSDIGAAASSHTHSYLPLSGGTLTGETTFNKCLSLDASSSGMGGTGKGQLSYDGMHKELVLKNISDIRIADNGALVLTSANPPTSISGNAGTATKLKTARAIKIGNTSRNFDGSGNVTWTLSDIGAAASSHTHSYLPLSGGTVNGTITTTNLDVAKTASFGGQIKIVNTSSPNTLSLEGATNANQAVIKFGNGARIYSGSNETRLIVEGGIYSNKIIEGADIRCNGSMYPTESAQGGWDIGIVTNRFYTLYAVNTNLSSDKNMKEDIVYLDDEPKTISLDEETSFKTPFKDFICNDLKVATYKYKRQTIEEDEDRNERIKDLPHQPEDSQIGFIAQDIINTEVGSMFV